MHDICQNLHPYKGLFSFGLDPTQTPHPLVGFWRIKVDAGYQPFSIPSHSRTVLVYFPHFPDRNSNLSYLSSLFDRLSLIRVLTAPNQGALAEN